jgi:SOS response regulatory protein OraA/RecX
MSKEFDEFIKGVEQQLPQQELSDEEIEKAAKNSAIEQFEAGNSVYTLAFQEGYKWYREQLKSKLTS